MFPFFSLKMLCDFKDSLRDEYEIREKLEQVSSSVGAVEIVWNGVLQRRFFQVPDICKYLSKTSKDYLVQNVDRENIESKLLEFVTYSHNMYKEVKYQLWLEQKGVSQFVNPTNLERSTWSAFTISFVVNMLFIAYYCSYDYVKDESSNEWIREVFYPPELILRGAHPKPVTT